MANKNTYSVQINEEKFEESTFKDIGESLHADNFKDPQVVSLPIDTALPRESRALLQTIKCPELVGIFSNVGGFHIFEKTERKWIAFDASSLAASQFNRKVKYYDAPNLGGFD